MARRSGRRAARPPRFDSCRDRLLRFAVQRSERLSRKVCADVNVVISRLCLGHLAASGTRVVGKGDGCELLTKSRSGTGPCFGSPTKRLRSACCSLESSPGRLNDRCIARTS